MSQELDTVLEYLKEYGHEIGSKAVDDEDLLCTQIMGHYKMYYDCPEPGAEVLLIDSVNEYIRLQAEDAELEAEVDKRHLEEFGE